MLVARTPYWTPHNGAFRDNTQRSKKQKLTHPPIMVPQIIVKVFLKWDKEEEDQAKMQEYRQRLSEGGPREVISKDGNRRNQVKTGEVDMLSERA